jgi:hypothetical protein
MRNIEALDLRLPMICTRSFLHATPRPALHRAAETLRRFRSRLQRNAYTRLLVVTSSRGVLRHKHVLQHRDRAHITRREWNQQPESVQMAARQ